MRTKSPCPFCGVEHDPHYQSGIAYYDCLGCFCLDMDECERFMSTLHSLKKQDEKVSWAILRYYLANKVFPNTKPGHKTPPLPFKEILEAYKLPSPAEQAENIILIVGDNTHSIGEEYEIMASSVSRWVSVENDPKAAEVEKQNKKKLNYFASLCGALSDNGIEVLIKQLREDKLLAGDSTYTLSLTLEGWRKYNELKKGRTESKTAFMAMQFSNTELEKFYKEHIKPAVEETGFIIKRLDEQQKAGLIDAALRLEIAQSSFIISDLTDENNGAYWEAGYAEGLGKPVIYIYDERKHKKEEKDSKKTKKIVCYSCKRKIKNAPHFDTNHHLTLFWNPENPQPFIEKLKATIIFTIINAR